MTTTGTGTGLRTDVKTDTRYGPNVGPIVKEMVATYAKADVELNWQMIEYVHQCRDKFFNDKRGLQKLVRAELEKHYDKEDAIKKSYYLNRAILIGFVMEREDVKKAKEEGKTFNTILEGVRNPNTATRLRKNSTRVENSLPKDGDKKPAAKKKQEQSGWISPAVKPDNEKTEEEILDILDSYFEGSVMKIKLLMKRLLERSRVKKAMIEVLKES